MGMDTIPLLRGWADHDDLLMTTGRNPAKWAETTGWQTTEDITQWPGKLTQGVCKARHTRFDE
jgi:hypothetical protein